MSRTTETLAMLVWTCLCLGFGSVIGMEKGLSTAVYQADDVRATRDHAESLRAELRRCIEVQERALEATEAAQITIWALWLEYRAAMEATDFDALVQP